MLRILVVGGGIGGLTAAVALRADGHEVSIVEQAIQLREIGAGVQLSPNATRILIHLGYGPGLERLGVRQATVRFLRWRDDTMICEQSREKVSERFGSPYYTMYRPELIELLAASLPADVVRLGAAATNIHFDQNQRPEIELADGQLIDADLVIGADGTHSMVRSTTIGNAPARFSGMCAYRALVPIDMAPPSLATQTVHCWLGPERHVVVYPVGQGGRFVNLVCVVPDPDWPHESWTDQASADQLRDHFADWSPILRSCLDAVTDPVFRWALYDREPLATWSTQSTTLLGDACHPMLPFMAQGAAQSIEDAAALAAQLRDHDNVADALTRYQQIRIPHTAKIQRLSWTNNTVFHLHDGPDQRRRDTAWATRDNDTWLQTQEWLYKNDPKAFS
ncbi:FAD-dependent monooxygenase [Pseudonocardia spinosispora]|uniref:FAD-dependent monooxygenase n=1 Tax=Pseudonocardia spinosispora TaxID=103441 RepID=UPI0009FF4372|nr:FAD-dependent monooxygenase [Pseudonocardia spinosispora]